MKATRIYSCLSATLMAALTCISASALADSIGVNLSEERDGAVRVEQFLAPEDVAGHPATAQANWNNYVITDTPVSGVVDDSGVAHAAVSVSWSASNAWGDSSADTGTPNGRLARGNFDDGNTDGNTGANGVDVDVTGIPYTEYSVLLYLSSDQGESGTFGLSSNDPPLEYQVNDQSAAGGQTLGFADYGGWVPGQNLLVFTGLSGDLDIIAPNRVDGSRGTLAGFQIVEGTVTIPEPTSLLLVGLGAAGLMFCRCRR